MFVIRSGSVEILVGDRIVETVENHCIFGEMAMIDGAPCSAASRAKEDCELVPINGRGFYYSDP